VTENAAGRTVEMEVRDLDGNIVATGSATLPRAKPALPDLATSRCCRSKSRCPHRSGGSGPATGSAAKPKRSRGGAARIAPYFRQTWPVFAEQGIVHPTKFPTFATTSAGQLQVVDTVIFVAAQHST